MVRLIYTVAASLFTVGISLAAAGPAMAEPTPGEPGVEGTGVAIAVSRVSNVTATFMNTVVAEQNLTNDQAYQQLKDGALAACSANGGVDCVVVAWHADPAIKCSVVLENANATPDAPRFQGGNGITIDEAVASAVAKNPSFAGAPIRDQICG